MRARFSPNRWSLWQHAQVAVALRVEGHRGDDADAQPELDVGLDHVRVEGRHHDVGRARVGEGLVDAGAAGEALVVGDQRMLGDASRVSGVTPSSGWPAGTITEWCQP